MNNDFVLTDSQRQMHRRDQLKLSSMKKSWSTDSLNSLVGGGKPCVCAPTSHPGSFKCRYHRHQQTNSNQPSQPPDTIFEEKPDADDSGIKPQPESAKTTTDDNNKVTFDM